MGNPVKLSVSSLTENYTHNATDNLIRIGRSDKCEFVIPKDDLSRQHCVFEIVNGEHFITDSGSKNGVTVDGIRVPANSRIKVNEKSEILLANVYALRINALNIKTKVDMTTKKEVKDQHETLSLQLDLPREVKRPQRPARRPVEAKSEKAPNSKALPMIILSALVLGFVIYQALGL